MIFYSCSLLCSLLVLLTVPRGRIYKVTILEIVKNEIEKWISTIDRNSVLQKAFYDRRVFTREQVDFGL